MCATVHYKTVTADVKKILGENLNFHGAIKTNSWFYNMNTNVKNITSMFLLDKIHS